MSVLKVSEVHGEGRGSDELARINSISLVVGSQFLKF